LPYDSPYAIDANATGYVQSIKASLKYQGKGEEFRYFSLILSRLEVSWLAED
jgi:hypothetical protein